jgi:hypothetical protein
MTTTYLYLTHSCRHYGEIPFDDLLAQGQLLAQIRQCEKALCLDCAAAEAALLAEPLQGRTPQMQAMYDGLLQAGGFQGHTQARATDTCVFCGKDATQFTDELSRREYAISGACQACQDVIFVDEEEDASTPDADAQRDAFNAKQDAEEPW